MEKADSSKYLKFQHHSRHQGWKTLHSCVGFFGQMSHDHHYTVPTSLNLSNYTLTKLSINKLKYAQSLVTVDGLIQSLARETHSLSCMQSSYNFSSITKCHLVWCQVAFVSMETAQALYCHASIAEAACIVLVVKLFPVGVSCWCLVKRHFSGTGQ